ncbi:MAG: TSCPD domain-containing protein [Acutalibacter sp.]
MRPKAPVPKKFNLEVDRGVIRLVEFVLGCPGFIQALSRLWWEWVWRMRSRN